MSRGARRRAIAALLGIALHLPLAARGLAAAADADPAAAFEGANAAFAEGRYEEAAGSFAAIVAAHGASPALLFNLGNASFRAGRIGEAILAYEQALALAPRSSSIAANLRQARSAANLSPPAEGALGAAVSLATADGWAWLASACAALACLLLGAARLLASRLAAQPGLARGLRAGAGAALVAAALAAAATWEGLRRLDRAVVIGDGLALQVAPFASATTSGPIASGEVVARDRLHAGFALVRTADGRTGWLPAERVRRIGDLAPPAPERTADGAGASATAPAR